jgi:hypothetical protein
MVGQQVGYLLPLFWMVGRQVATLLPQFVGCPHGGRQVGYPIGLPLLVCWQQAGYPIAPLFPGCPHDGPAGWLPYCHYLQDAHVVGRQVGYPNATLCRMPT